MNIHDRDKRMSDFIDFDFAERSHSDKVKAYFDLAARLEAALETTREDRINLAIFMNRQLRETGARPYKDSSFTFTINQEVKLVAALMTGRTFTRDQLVPILALDPQNPPTGKIVDVALCRARRALRPLGIEITNIPKIGFFMAPDMIEKLKAAVIQPLRDANV